jgi:hypothetical protein
LMLLGFFPYIQDTLFLISFYLKLVKITTLNTSNSPLNFPFFIKCF